MPIRTELNTQLTASYSMAGSTIEDIDFALYNFVNDDLNIFVDTNEGFEKVPVLYSIPERAYQIKNDPQLRPNGRTLLYPLITINKTGLVQNPSNKGAYGVHQLPIQDYYSRGGSIPIVRQVEQASTQKYANTNSIRKSDGGQRVTSTNLIRFLSNPLRVKCLRTKTLRVDSTSLCNLPTARENLISN